MFLNQMQRALLLIIFGISAGAAALRSGLAETRPDPWSVPEFRAVVLIQAPVTGPAEVDVQVTGHLTDEQARTLIGQAGSIGGWSPGPISVKRETFQSGRDWEQITGRKAKPERLTAAHFQANGLVGSDSGRLAVKEFVQALQGYSPVRVVYKVDKKFSYSGPDDEDFERFHIAHYQTDGTHTFDVLPSGRPAAETSAGTPAKAARLRRFPWLGAMLCVVALAMAVGAGVWKWRLGRSQHKITQEGDSSGN